MEFDMKAIERITNWIKNQRIIINELKWSDNELDVDNGILIVYFNPCDEKYKIFIHTPKIKEKVISLHKDQIRPMINRLKEEHSISLIKFFKPIYIIEEQMKPPAYVKFNGKWCLIDNISNCEYIEMFDKTKTKKIYTENFEIVDSIEKFMEEK